MTIALSPLIASSPALAEGPFPVTPRCVADGGWFGPLATIVGTSAGEVIQGTAGDDVIVGFGGDDTIVGNGGHDTICGGAGNDRIFAGAEWFYDEIDTVTGEGSYIYGQGGSDTIYGSAHNDSLYGGAGWDSLNGPGGNDQMYGGKEVDFLTGGKGSDYGEGGPGDDWHSGDFDGSGNFALYTCGQWECFDDGSADSVVDDQGDNILIAYRNLDSADFLYVTTRRCDTTLINGLPLHTDSGDQVFCGPPGP
jgi:Ca2+-binding RTX toxin-like protein